MGEAAPRRYVVNRKRVQRLLRLWGYGLTRPRPHPKAQGRPFDVTAPNQLWQTDMTAIWCGEDDRAYLTAVLDCFDRSILGWSFTPRCRARDFSPAVEHAWSSAWPYGPSAQIANRDRLDRKGRLLTQVTIALGLVAGLALLGNVLAVS